MREFPPNAFFHLETDGTLEYHRMSLAFNLFQEAIIAYFVAAIKGSITNIADDRVSIAAVNSSKCSVHPQNSEIPIKNSKRCTDALEDGTTKTREKIVKIQLPVSVFSIFSHFIAGEKKHPERAGMKHKVSSAFCFRKLFLLRRDWAEFSQREVPAGKVLFP